MKVTFAIVVICFAVFVLQVALGEQFTETFALNPIKLMSGAWWQIFTYMFLHGNVTHIFINMFVLMIFGFMVERILGTRQYLLLYFTSGIGSAILHLLLTGVMDVSMLGASGAVFGIITAYAIMFPRSIIFMFPGIPMPAILAVAIFAFLEFVFGVFGLEPGIANWGHLGGIIAGLAYMFFWKREQRKRPRIDFVWE